MANLHQAVIAILACMSFVSCNASHSPQASPGGNVAVSSERGSGPQDRYITSTSPRFKDDVRRAQRKWRELAPDSVSQRRLAIAVTGSSFLMLGHETGHEFMRIFGAPAGFDRERLADLFAVNLLMDSDLPSDAMLEASSLVLAMGTFSRSAPASHMGTDRTRARGFNCAYIGVLNHMIKTGDPYVEWARANGWEPAFQEIVQHMRVSDEINGFPRSKWEEIQKNRDLNATLSLLLLMSADGAPGADLQHCTDEREAFLTYLDGRVSNNERLQRLVAQGDKLGIFEGGKELYNKNLERDSARFRLEYEVPETEGALLLFYFLTPDGDRPALSALPRSAILNGWLPGDPDSILVRARYCGIGLANAHIEISQRAAEITLCYEIGEEIIENIDSYDSSDAVKLFSEGRLSISTERKGH